jgi:hypothetical protein
MEPIVDINDLTESMETLLASDQEIPASDMRLFQAKMIAGLAMLNARTRGNKIFYTAGPPSNALGQPGDLGIDKVSGDFSEFKGGKFVFLFNVKPRPAPENPGTDNPGTGTASFATLLGQPEDNPALNAIIEQLEAVDATQKARLDALLQGAPATLDSFIEAYNRFLAGESVAAALTAQMGQKADKADTYTKVQTNTLLADKVAKSQIEQDLSSNSTTNVPSTLAVANAIAGSKDALRNSIRLQAAVKDFYFTLGNKNSAYDITLGADIGNTLTLHLPTVTAEHVGGGYSIHLLASEVGKKIVVMGRYANTPDDTEVVLVTLNPGDVATATMLRVYGTTWYGYSITAFSALGSGGGGGGGSITLAQNLNSNSTTTAPSVRAVATVINQIEEELADIIRIPAYTAADFGKVLGLTSAGVLAWIDPTVNLIYSKNLTVNTVTPESGTPYKELDINLPAAKAALAALDAAGSTPAAPTLYADDVNNTLSAAIPAGETVEMRADNGAWGDYNGAIISITDIDLDAEFYEFRIKANGEHGPGLTAPSPKFTKAYGPQLPGGTEGPDNLLPYSGMPNADNAGWGQSQGNRMTIEGFDGSNDSGTNVLFFQNDADWHSPTIGTVAAGVLVTTSIFVKPRESRRQRFNDIEGKSMVLFDFDALTATPLVEGMGSGTITDVSHLGGKYVGAYRVTHTYTTSYFLNLLIIFNQSGFANADYWGGMLNLGATAGPYKATY